MQRAKSEGGAGEGVPTPSALSGFLIEKDLAVPLPEVETAAMYRMIDFDASVFPAPDSPEMTTQQSASLRRIPV